nr:immunoglobulin light chain junction region [Macaca mulatta]
DHYCAIWHSSAHAFF